MDSPATTRNRRWSASPRTCSPIPSSKNSASKSSIEGHPAPRCLMARARAPNITGYVNLRKIAAALREGGGASDSERIEMCGIVGYIGQKRVVPLIFDGLKRLEYRGYDSAGIAVVGEDGKMGIRRASGKLRNLEEAIRVAPL